jgi:hypothetical protein
MELLIVNNNAVLCKFYKNEQIDAPQRRQLYAISPKWKLAMSTFHLFFICNVGIVRIWKISNIETLYYVIYTDYYF